MMPPPGFDELPAEEKLDYINQLWSRVLENPEQVTPPEWHEEAVAERLAAQRADPDAARPWEEVRAEIQAELRKIRR